MEDHCKHCGTVWVTMLMKHFQFSRDQVTIEFPHLIHSAILVVLIQKSSYKKNADHSILLYRSAFWKREKQNKTAELISKVLLWVHWSIMLLKSKAFWDLMISVNLYASSHYLKREYKKRISPLGKLLYRQFI